MGSYTKEFTTTISSGTYSGLYGVRLTIKNTFTDSTSKSKVKITKVEFKDPFTRNAPLYGKAYIGNSSTVVADYEGGSSQINTSAGSYVVCPTPSATEVEVQHGSDGKASVTVGILKSSSLSGNFFGVRYSNGNWGVDTPKSATVTITESAPYSITYNANKGSGAPSSQAVFATHTYTLSETIPTRTGYEFKGWATSSSATTEQYHAGDSVTISGNLALYAVWKIKSYTVTCKDYVGSTSGTLLGTNTASYNYGSSVSGASFGSSTTYDAYYTGYHYTSSSSAVTVPANNNTVVYRYFAINTWTVSYNANGHGTAPSSQTKTYGVDLKLRAFIGNTSGTGTKANYTVTAKANGSTWSGSNGSASKTPKYTYSQTGWNTSSSGTGTNYGSASTYSVDGTAKLYAIWNTATSYTYTYTLPTGTPTKSESVTVTFNANGGSTTKASQSVSRAMTFSGWYTKASGGTKRTSSSKISADENVYAQFTNGTGSYGAATLPTAAQCTKTGFTLKGWYTAASGGSKVGNPGASYTPTANVTLYAQWTPLTYTLSFTKSPDGVVANVTRTESPNGGSFGPLNNGATLYYGDKLQVAYSVNSGYTLQTATINGVTMSDTSVIVGPISGAIVVVITVELGAIVYIGGQDYQIFIWDGSNWNQYEAYIWDGSNWIPY